MTLQIQEYIKQFKSVHDANIFLSNEFKLRIEAQILHFQRDEKETVYIYNSKPTSPMCEITKEANGLILNKQGEIVSMSFKKFYEFDNLTNAPLDISKARVEHLLDGDRVVVYKYKDDMFIQTNRRVMGDNLVSTKVVDTFRGYTNSLLYKFIGKDFESIFDDEKCYTFELVSPLTRKITHYNKTMLFIIAIFDKTECRELKKWEVDAFARPFSREIELARPRFFFINNIFDIKQNMFTLEPLSKGFVFVDDGGNRAKYTRPIYRALESIIEGSDINIIDFATVITAGHVNILDNLGNKFNLVYEKLQDTLEHIVTLINGKWSKLNEVSIDSEFLKELDKLNFHDDMNLICYALRRRTITNASQGIKFISPGTLVLLTKGRYTDFIYQCKQYGIETNINLRLDNITALQNTMEDNKDAIEAYSSY